MKAAIIADLHLKMWSDDTFLEDGTPLKLKEIIDVVRDVCKYCLENHINTVIIAGDINDTKDSFSVRAFLLLRKVLEEFSDINWIILHGNHDLASNISSEVKYSAIELFDSLPNCKLILEPEILTVEDTEILFVPYTNNILAKIKQLSENLGQIKILIGHFGVNEAILSSGISVKSDVSLQDLKDFQLVILGHYHKPQKISNLYYVGSPIQIRRDEVNEEKRFLDVDFDTLEVKSIETKGYRRYIELEIENEDDLQKLDSIEVFDKKYIVVKLRANLNMDKRRYLEENCMVVDLTEENVESRGISLNMSLDEQLVKYLEYKNIVESDRQYYLDVVKECLGNSNNAI